MQYLYDYAKMLDVRIEYTDLSGLGRDGDYHHRSRTIRLNHGMLERKHRSVLAHELGHATYGDEPTIFDHMNAQQERRADEWAAHELIDPDAYRDAEAIHKCHVPSLAQELNVLKRIVVAYQRTLLRIGDVVYVNSKQGAGQWDQKVEVA